ncbi:hypothetical protein J2772_002855 [Chryseobacterium jejuense]|nr:hypothetical protein [Chryseobacterium jejuense]
MIPLKTASSNFMATSEIVAPIVTSNLLSLIFLSRTQAQLSSHKMKIFDFQQNFSALLVHKVYHLNSLSV